jgi:hypothetical protein
LRRARSLVDGLFDGLFDAAFFGFAGGMDLTPPASIRARCT